MVILNFIILVFIYQKSKFAVTSIRNNHNGEKLSEKDASDYVLERFDQIKKQSMVNELVNFHTINKYLLMAHSQKHLKILGNIVANHEKKSISEMLAGYEINLNQALSSQPTIKSNINVLMHIFGSFSKFFNNSEKELYLYLLNLYRDKKNTLGKTLAEIEPLVYRFNNTYLASQTYFLLYTDVKKGDLFSYLSKLKYY